VKNVLRLATVSFLILFVSKIIFCATIGSDSSVERFNVQQVLQNGDRVAGFAALQGGFVLRGEATTATFDSFFPVSESVDLRCGTIVLDRDLIFNDVADFTRIGNITGQGHTMELASTMNIIPGALTVEGPDCECVANNLVDFDTLAGTVIDTVHWSPDDKFLAIGLGDLDNQTSGTGRFKIYSFENEALAVAVSDPATSYWVHTVAWNPTSPSGTKYLIAMGKGYMSGDMAYELRIYEFDSSGPTLTQKDAVNFSSDVNAVSWHPNGRTLAVGVRNSQTLRLYDVDSTGNITNSNNPIETISLAGNSWIHQEALDWSRDGDFLAAGLNYDGSNPDFIIYEFNSTTTTLSQHVTKTYGHGSGNPGRGISGVDWNKTHTGFVGAGAFGESGTGPRLFVLEHNEFGVTGAERLVERASFGNVTETTPTIYIFDWSPSGNCLAVGSNERDPSDKIEEFQTFRYDFDNHELIPAGYAPFEEEVEAVSWSNDGNYVAIGSDVDEFKIYVTGCGCGDTGCVTFSDLNIFMNHDLLLRNCCIIFDGLSSINGRGNTLTLAPTCTIIVEAGASLEIEDLQLKGIHSERFYSTDNLSTLTFSDVDLVLDNDYSFTIGKIDIVQDLRILGEGHTFAHKSVGETVVRECSRLIVDNNVTFSYDPSINSKQLLRLEDKTSELHLRGGTLHATATGLRLTKGIFNADRASEISSEATVEAEALQFGDGTDSANDIDFQGLPAAEVAIKEGIVLFDNVIG